MQLLKLRNVMPVGLLPMLFALLMATGCEVSHIVDDSGNNNGDFTVSEPFSFHVDAIDQSGLYLQGVNGDIEIVGVPGATTVEIWGKRSVTSESTADASAYLENLEVRVTQTNSEIVVETVQPRDTHGRNLEVTYHIRMPDDWRVVVTNVNGNVVVDSLRANVEIGTVNGTVRLQEISATVSVGLTNGNVFMSDIFGSTYISLTNGNINAVLELPPAGTCDLNTVNGTIDLQIPTTTSAMFAADVANGTIRIDNLSLQNSTTTNKSVRGQLGDGNGKVVLKTVNGSIHVDSF